jgi:hypothetical protein
MNQEWRAKRLKASVMTARPWCIIALPADSDIWVHSQSLSSVTGWTKGLHTIMLLLIQSSQVISHINLEQNFQRPSLSLSSGNDVM